MGVVTQRKGHGETAGKQRGSGEYSASEDNAAKNISESRMHKQNNNGRRHISMANKKEINGCTTVWRNWATRETIGYMETYG